MTTGEEHDVATVHQWTGLEARALRKALRKSIRGFAEHLGVAVNTVAKWEKLLADTTPQADSQAILDTVLARADPAVQERFGRLLDNDGVTPRLRKQPAPSVGDHETWAEDLERAVVCLSRQDFGFAWTLLDRWLHRVPPCELDDRGQYLYARTLTLFGDMRRLQGTVCDLITAASVYADARSLFVGLRIPRRTAQIDLSLAVVEEMSGRLAEAASRYGALAEDARLSRLDRVRARLWIGTALSKQGEADSAIVLMRSAAREFYDLAEPEDWAVAQQKLALAHRGAGDLTHALRYIETARSAGRPNSPLEHVQLDTAHAHILLSDPATAGEGRTALAGAAATAGRHGLGHQLRSIEAIREAQEYA
ncbi:helix-turn-helix domain-containing protein [Streptomyces sp. NPDC057644]|uniref:helix-turn-helix domain-containing protein n=1 Tax=Streptomyces sp. NPDC057644 TaxID=3346191 RepID=UPI00369D2878